MIQRRLPRRSTAAEALGRAAKTDGDAAVIEEVVVRQGVPQVLIDLAALDLRIYIAIAEPRGTIAFLNRSTFSAENVWPGLQHNSSMFFG